jgi:hypothetical protein
MLKGLNLSRVPGSRVCYLRTFKSHRTINQISTNYSDQVPLLEEISNKEEFLKSDPDQRSREQQIVEALKIDTVEHH